MEEAARSLAQTTVQDRHIICHPSPSRDIVPPTSADRPLVSIVRDALPSIQFSSSRANLHHLSQRHHSEDEDDDETVSEISLEDSPHPSSSSKPRRPNLPPIPDLRFEQSYLKQLEAAKGSVMWMIIITIREQVLFPGVQGFLWALGLAGIRTLRTRQAESGRGVGSWLRDWFGRLGKIDPTMTMSERSRKFSIRK
jgi:Autophagy receptor ATG43